MTSTLKKSLFLAIGSLVLFSACELTDEGDGKIRLGQLEGDPVTPAAIQGDWRSGCVATSGNGIKSFQIGYKFSQSSTFSYRLHIFSEAGCLGRVANETGNGNYSTLEAGAKIKFNITYRYVQPVTSTQVSVYNQANYCAVTWRMNEARDVTASSCTATLNAQPAMAAALVQSDNDANNDRLNIQNCGIQGNAAACVSILMEHLPLLEQ